MNRFIKLSAVMAAVIAAPAFAAVSMDANLELDTKSLNNGRGMFQGGRVEFNVAGKAGGDAGFVAARGSALLLKTGAAIVDDMWGQIGTSQANVKFGRFEAMELFAVGKDVIVEDDLFSNPSFITGPGFLGHARTNVLRGRFGNNFFNNVNANATHAALTVNAAPGVAIEVGVVENKAPGAVKGVRPAVAFGAGPLKVKLGVESGKVNANAPTLETKFTGFGAVVAAPLAGGTLSANFSTRTDKVTGSADVKHTAFGLTGVFGPAGIAYIADKDGGVKQNTIYAAYSLPLFNTGATFTPAASYSKAKGSTSANSAIGVRVNYAF